MVPLVSLVRFSRFLLLDVALTLFGIVLAGAMLEQAETLLDKGIHPSRIADGFERACQIAVKHLENVSDTVPFTPQETSNLFKVAKTCLGSKMYTSRLSR